MLSKSSGHRNEGEPVVPWPRSGIPNGIPNFSRFPRLHELNLSAYKILNEEASEAAAKLAAPMLRHLTMTFDTKDEHKPPWPVFTRDQVIWIVDFSSQI